MTIDLADGSTISVHQQVKLDFCFVGKPHTYASLSYLVKQLEHDVILGYDFIEEHRLLLPNSEKWIPSPVGASRSTRSLLSILTLKSKGRLPMLYCYHYWLCLHRARKNPSTRRLM